MLQHLSSFLESAHGAPHWKVCLLIAVLIVCSLRMAYLVIQQMRKNRGLRIQGTAIHRRAVEAHFQKLREGEGRF